MRGARIGTRLVAWMTVSAVLAVVAPGRAEADELVDRVMAVAGGEVIMLSDVVAARDFGLVSGDASADPVRGVLAQLIDRALILAEVDRYAPPEPSADAIRDEVGAIRRRFPASEAFDGALARTGLDEKGLTELVRQTLRIRGYLDQRFSAGAPDRRDALVADWVAGLRRRAEIVDLSVTTP